MILFHIYTQIILSLYVCVSSKIFNQDNSDYTNVKSNVQIEQAQIPVRYLSAAMISSKRTHYWPNATIPFVINDNLGHQQNIIKLAMKHISNKTCIRFKKRNKQKNYIYFTNGTGGRQNIVLGKKCHFIGVIIHEILHSLGLYHEHQRYDRDQYLTINWQNILEDEYSRSQFTLLNKKQMHIYSDFDFNSIMFYGSKAFSKNNQDTIVPKVKNITLISSSNKTSLSHSDIMTIKSIYCQKRSH